MAFRSTRNQGSFRGGKKRLTEWGLCSVPTGFSTIGANTKVALVLFPAATLAPESPATIVRSRLHLSVRPVTGGGADVNMVGAFGCGFVNVVAGALGVTALPGPATDCSWGGWFVWQPIGSAFEFITGSGARLNSTEYVIDSKAMRKFEADMSLVWMIENSTSVAWDAMINGRMLVKAG